MKFNITITLSLLLLASINLIGCEDSKVSNKQDAAKVIYNTDSTTVKFSGVVTNAKNECWSDGMCRIEVDHNWWVVISTGLIVPTSIPVERGKATGIRFTKDNESIGKKVAVYANIRDNNLLLLDLIGSTDYYVKVLETKILKNNIKNENNEDNN